jgi:NhaP-type Na+/H+ or K+/H+ antiporter
MLGIAAGEGEFCTIDRVVAWLVTLGAGITWAIGTLAAHWTLGLDWPWRSCWAH